MPSGPSLLLVDDDLALCEAMRRALTRRGFDVTAAHTAAQAWSSAQSRTPEYAVIDLKMPGDSGLTLIPRLKSLSEPMRIVVLTGYASVTTAVEAIKLGATHYLAKPVDADQVVAAATGAASRVETQKMQTGPGRASTRHIHKDSANGRVLAEHWVVHGAPHAWSGGSSRGSYTDSRGPDASAEMVRFFLEHPHPALQ